MYHTLFHTLFSLTALFQTLEYSEWAAQGLELDMITSLSHSIFPPLFRSFFVITSALGVGYGDVYPRTPAGKVLLIALFAMIIIFIPRNVASLSS